MDKVPENFTTACTESEREREPRERLALRAGVWGRGLAGRLETQL